MEENEPQEAVQYETLEMLFEIHACGTNLHQIVLVITLVDTYILFHIITRYWH